MQIFSAADRAGLINDAFSNVRAGELPVGIAMDLLEYLPHESDLSAWEISLAHLMNIHRLLLDNHELYLKFKEFKINLLKKMYSKDLWNVGRSHDDKY